MNHEKSRNALSLEMINILLYNISKDLDNPELRSIVIRAAPGKVFSAGHNLKELVNFRIQFLNLGKNYKTYIKIIIIVICNFNVEKTVITFKIEIIFFLVNKVTHVSKKNGIVTLSQRHYYLRHLDDKER